MSVGNMKCSVHFSVSFYQELEQDGHVHRSDCITASNVMKVCLVYIFQLFSKGSKFLEQLKSNNLEIKVLLTFSKEVKSWRAMKVGS